MTSMHTYLRNFCLALIAGLCAVVIFVVIVDPYGLYRIVERNGFNKIKPGLTRYHHQIKLEHAIDGRKSNIIFGNSRSEIGFDPASPALRQATPRFYNLSVPGSSINDAGLKIDSLVAAGIKPKSLLLGIEFLDAMNAPVSGAKVAPAIAPGQGSLLADAWQWRFDTLFSLTTLWDAWKTLRIQKNGETETITEDGANPLNEYKRLVKLEGYNALFRQRSRENALTYVRKASGKMDITEFSKLAAILEQMAGLGGETQVVIYPYHAQILAMMDEAGLTPALKEWKRLLIDTVVTAKIRHPELKVRIFDFSGFGEYQCSAIPAKGFNESDSPLYWEAGHFKSALGDIALATIVQSTGNNSAPSSSLQAKLGMGTPLTRENFVLNEQRIQDERKQCETKHPELFTEAKTLIANAKQSLALTLATAKP